MSDPTPNARHDQEESDQDFVINPPQMSDQFSNATTRELITEVLARMIHAEHSVHIVWYLEGCCREALTYLPLNLLEFPNSIEVAE
jgi:hypothetical protein